MAILVAGLTTAVPLAQADDMYQTWSATVSGLTGISSANWGQALHGTYQVTGPAPGPLAGHGEQHDYTNTELDHFTFQMRSGTGQVFSYVYNVFQDFGQLSFNTSYNRQQNFSWSELTNVPASSWTITGVTAWGSHVYAIPEPEMYALMLAGLAALGLRLRRQPVEPQAPRHTEAQQA